MAEATGRLSAGLADRYRIVRLRGEADVTIAQPQWLPMISRLAAAAIR